MNTSNLANGFVHYIKDKNIEYQHQTIKRTLSCFSKEMLKEILYLKDNEKTMTEDEWIQFYIKNSRDNIVLEAMIISEYLPKIVEKKILSDVIKYDIDLDVIIYRMWNREIHNSENLKKLYDYTEYNSYNVEEVFEIYEIDNNNLKKMLLEFRNEELEKMGWYPLEKINPITTEAIALFIM